MAYLKTFLGLTSVLFFGVIHAQFEQEIAYSKKFIIAVHKKDPTELRKMIDAAVQIGLRDPDKFLKLMTIPDASGWTPFMHSIEIGDVNRIDMFINAFVRVLDHNTKKVLEIVNYQDVHGRTALHLAAERRQDKVAIDLVKRFGEIFANDKKSFFEILNNRDRHLGWTPLMAATYDSASVIMLVILREAAKRLGKDSDYYQDFINARGFFGQSAVLLSIDPRDRWMLLHYGARDDVEAQYPLSKELKLLGRKFLHYSSHEGHEDDIKQFFKLLAEKFPENYQTYLYVLTTRDEGGWTALMNASADGNAKYVDMILDGTHNLFKTDTSRVATPGRENERQSDPLWFSLVLNNADVHGRTSIHLAIARRHLAVFNTLLSTEKKFLGDDRRTFNRFINNRTELNGFTPLLLAAYRSSNDELSYQMIKMLVDRMLEASGRDSIDYELFINAKDFDRQTPLAYVVSPKIQAFLKKNGAKLP